LLALQTLRGQPEPIQLSADAAEILVLADWEGNVRQLRHAMGRALEQALASDERAIRAEHLPDITAARDRGEALTPKRIQAAMVKAGGVALRAAQLLGVSRTTLYNSMKRLKIDPVSLRGR